MEKIFVTTAIYNKDRNYYHNFGIVKKFAYMWGEKPENVFSIEFKISEDQSSPDWKKHDYWGWYDNKRQKFTFIYPDYISLYICFPYGIKAEEDAGKGKAYRLEVTRKITQDGEEGGLLNH